jgi:hypothetical protein
MEVVKVAKSELKSLLEKNCSAGLTHDEFNKAMGLIRRPVLSKERCWIDKMLRRGNNSYPAEPAIFDTGLCQSHAQYALFTQK